VERARTTRSGIAEAGGPAPGPLYAELRGALQANGLSVEFQPVLRLDTSEREGYEALARSRHPVSGEPVSPTVFVTLAEEAGLAAELTRRGPQAVLCEFKPLYAANSQLHSAINLSARAFDSALPAQVQSALAV
jgi:EAL domain-containing protein (putative c-di-GMP-specific phosphodiesterase class I)